MLDYVEIDPLNNLHIEYANYLQIEEYNKYVIIMNEEMSCFQVESGRYEELPLDAKIPIEEYNKLLKEIKEEYKVSIYRLIIMLLC